METVPISRAKAGQKCTGRAGVADSVLPNIVYIISDEHRGQAMSHMGDVNVRTPHMDCLADEGISFTRAYANCPVCTPSRGTIFSGRHAHAGPVQSFWDVYKPIAPSTAWHLRGAGHHTCYIGKWHPGIVRDQVPPAIRNNAKELEHAHGGLPRRTPENMRGGFENWFGFETGSGHWNPWYYYQNEVDPRRLEGYTTDVFTDMAIDYINGYDEQAPLFMVLSVVPPHFPLSPPDEWIRLRDDEVELRPNVLETSDIPHTRERLPDLRNRLARYYGMIENLDWNIGRLVATLDSLQRFRDTLIVYISDHGELMGSHGRIERKEHPHEESVRIPAIFRWPEHIPSVGKRDELFSLVDLQKTVLSLVELGAPEYDQGFDCSETVLNRPGAPHQNTILLEMHGSPRWILDEPDWRGVVTKDWKYAFYDTGEELLFELNADPFEMTNLAEVQLDKKRELKSLLLDMLKESREPYFDVLMQHGVPPAGPVVDVSAIT